MDFLNGANYSFNPLGLLWYVSSALVFVGGIIALRRRSYDLTHRSFFLFSICIGLWLFAAGMGYMTHDVATHLFWSKVVYLGVVYVSPAFLLFTSALFGLTQKMRYPLIIAFGIGTVFLPLIWFTDLFYASVKAHTWGLYPVFGPAYSPFSFFFGFFMIWGFILAVRQYRKSTSDIEKRRIRPIFFAFLIAFLGSYDYLPGLGVETLPLGFLTEFVWFLLVARILLRFEVFSVTPQIAAPTIISTMSDALLVSDAAGSIVIANQAAASMLHQKNDPKILLEKPIKTYLPQSETFWKKILQTSKNVPDLFSGEETTLCGADRKNISVSLSLGIIRDVSGQPMGMTVVAHDLTRINELIAELRSQKKNLEKVNAKLSKQTDELTARTEEAERLNKLAVGRELKMIELKKQMEEMEKEK